MLYLYESLCLFAVVYFFCILPVRKTLYLSKMLFESPSIIPLERFLQSQKAGTTSCSKRGCRCSVGDLPKGRLVLLRGSQKSKNL